MADVLGFVPHARGLDFFIQHILFIIAEEYFQLICAVSLVAHIYHFLSKLLYPAIVLMLLYCGEYKGKIKNCHSTGAMVAPVSLAVLVFAVILSDIGYQVNVKKG